MIETNYNSNSGDIQRYIGYEKIIEYSGTNIDKIAKLSQICS